MFDEALLLPGFDDGEEVEVGIGVDAPGLDADRAERQQRQRVAGRCQRRADGVEAIQ